MAELRHSRGATGVLKVAAFRASKRSRSRGRHVSRHNVRRTDGENRGGAEPCMTCGENSDSVDLGSNPGSPASLSLGVPGFLRGGQAGHGGTDSARAPHKSRHTRDGRRLDRRRLSDGCVVPEMLAQHPHRPRASRRALWADRELHRRRDAHQDRLQRLRHQAARVHDRRALTQPSRIYEPRRLLAGSTCWN